MRIDWTLDEFECVRQELVRTPDDLYILFNVGLGALYFGRLEEARSAFDELIIRRPKYTAHDYIYGGAVHWLLNDRKRAADYWADGSDCDGGDFAGNLRPSLLTYFASVCDPQSFKLNMAERLIRVALARPQCTGWPRPIGSFLINAISEPVVREWTVESPESVRDHHIAMTDFYVGVAKLRDSNSDDTRRMWQRCGDAHCQVMVEQFIAQFELQRGLVLPYSE